MPIALGARDDDVPRTWSELSSLMAETYASGVIIVTDEARGLASAVLSPPLATLSGPLASINRLITRGLLPPAVRAQYGYSWTATDSQRLDRMMRFLKRTRRWLPRSIAIWPEAKMELQPKPSQ